MSFEDILGSGAKFFAAWTPKVLRILWIIWAIVSLPFAWLGGASGLLIFVAVALAIASYRKPVLIWWSVAAYILHFLTAPSYPFH